MINKFWRIININTGKELTLEIDRGFDSDGDEVIENTSSFTNFEILCFCKTRNNEEISNYKFEQI